MGKFIAALVLSTAIAQPVFAHEGGHRAFGVVKEVTTTRIVVTDEHGKDMAFALTAGTRYLRDRKPAQRDEVTVGERVVVNGEDSGGQLEATTVNVGPAPARKR